MDIWFLQDMQRLSVEREALERLTTTADWLRGVKWTLDGALLCVDATIRAYGHEYPIRMTYPALFPSVPLSVSPRNSHVRWSSHQYRDGTLCLEWGPDNWHPGVTGAQVLESAHRLIDIENPLGTDHSVVAPSRHRLSLGQQLRSKRGRFYASSDLRSFLATLPSQCCGLLDFSIQFQSRSFLILIQRVSCGEARIWTDTSIPEAVRASEESDRLHKGALCLKTLDSDSIGALAEASDVETLLKQVEQEHLPSVGAEIERFARAPGSVSGLLLLDSARQPHFLLILNREKLEVMHLALVSSESDGTRQRMPSGLDNLSDKSVGIVGVGSLGSKVTLSLARAGVSRFFLVDEDVFLPENICRHVLDWRNVGEHKVDAVATRLSRIAPNVEADVSRLRLTGQESTLSLSATLDRLGRSDLIFDATAQPEVFNILVATARGCGRPLVWAEVYAGGIGGMIARSRPGHDPDPHTMRAAYHHYTSESPAHGMSVRGAYTGETPDGLILPASDADVSILAYHATRLAIDSMLEREPSMFPYSMYLVGLARSWVFDAPFHTIPINTAQLFQHEDTEAPSDETVTKTVEFVSELLEGTRDEDSPVTSD